ncbi:MAG: heparinase II/III family protein, partial [Alphaproteobacteria bacterium]|nr:heparinase II/III family protein [Alphaproteobacteria bacterium]
HFTAQGGDAARRQVESLISSWLKDFERWNVTAWQPDVLASRIIAWLSNARMAASTSDLVYHSSVMRSMARQARHLARTAHRARDGLPRLRAAIGLMYSGFCLPDGEDRLKKGRRLLEQELSRQVLPDGGLISRDPSDIFAALKDLVALRTDLQQAGEEVPVSLQNAIDRLAPMVRFFRLGDGKLALFNGSFEEDEGMIDAVLAASRAEGRPVTSAIHSGFQRAEAGDVILILDAGAPPKGDLSVDAHCGTSAFEMSVGGFRLITSCGSSEQLSLGWQRASRATAAHSTLTIDNRNSAVIRPNQKIGTGPKTVKAVREEGDDGIGLEVRHDGYLGRLGVDHIRRLHLSANGRTLYGQDRVVNPYQKPPKHSLVLDVRFHLHPDVEMHSAGDGVDLSLPDGRRFRLSCRNADLATEESIYMGERGNPRATHQLVISTRADGPETLIDWQLVELTNEDTDNHTNGNKEEA